MQGQPPAPVIYIKWPFCKAQYLNHVEFHEAGLRIFVPGMGSGSWDSARCVFLIVNEMEAYFFRALDRFFLNLGYNVSAQSEQKLREKVVSCPTGVII